MTSPDRPDLFRLHTALRMQSAQSIMFGAAVASRVGLNQVDLECLDILQLEGPMPVGQLARRASLGTATITGVLDRLERRGFAARIRDTADRRIVHVRVEPKALQEIGPHYAGLMQRMGTVVESLSPEELAIVTRFTEAAVEAVRASLAEAQSR